MLTTKEDLETLTDAANAGGTANMVTRALARVALDARETLARIEEAAKPCAFTGAAHEFDAGSTVCACGKKLGPLP